MRLFTTPAAVFIAALLCLLAGGCSRVSPAVGTWSLAGRGGSPATLALREDGTGTFTMAPLPQQPVSWTEKEGTVTLQIGGGTQGSAGAAPQTRRGAGASLTGTLAEDKKSMTLTFGPTTLTLQKQGD